MLLSVLAAAGEATCRRDPTPREFGLPHQGDLDINFHTRAGTDDFCVPTGAATGGGCGGSVFGIRGC